VNFISYGGKVFVTDGFTKRHIASPTQLNELHAAAGKPPIQAVSKATHDSLPDYVPVSVVLNAINSCEALVETHRRQFIDWTYTQA